MKAIGIGMIIVLWLCFTNAWADEKASNIKDVRIYVDGKPDPRSAFSSCTIDTFPDDNVSIGAFHNVDGTYSSFFSGQIDDVRIYDRALGAEEIKSLADE